MRRYGELIRTMRLSRGWSQGQLADKIGKTRTAVSNYESDTRRPDYETLEALADAFNVPMSAFFDKTDAEGEETQDEMTQLREDLRRRPEMRTLFSLTRKATPKQVRMVVKMLEAMRDGDADE